MVQSTPATEFIGNDLIKEFSERARQAHKSVQGYMACDNPAPDEDTMLTLIETSEQLNIAMSKHQRGLLQARKATGQAVQTPPAQQNSQDPFSTTQLQNSLPQQPLQPQPQSQPYQQYNNYQQPNTQGGYGLVSPIQPHEREGFNAPPGAPPARNAEPVQAYEYSAPPGPPPRKQQESQHVVSPTTPTATQAYEIGDNPFTDEAYAAPNQNVAPQQNSYSLFSRAAGQLGSQNQSQRPPPTESYENPYQTPAQTSPQRPGVGSGWQETPSFVNRQDSATNHITMHGGAAKPQE